MYIPRLSCTYGNSTYVEAISRLPFQSQTCDTMDNLAVPSCISQGSFSAVAKKHTVYRLISSSGEVPTRKPLKDFSIPKKLMRKANAN